MKENFDDIIRRRWEQKQFPVDDTHRQEMARMLEGEKKRRGLVFWWFGGLAVVLLIGGALWNSKAKDSTKGQTEETFVQSGTNEALPADANASHQAITGVSDHEGGKGVKDGEMKEVKDEAEFETNKVVSKPAVSKRANVETTQSTSAVKNAKSSKKKNPVNENPQTDAQLKAHKKQIEHSEKAIVANEKSTTLDVGKTPKAHSTKDVAVKNSDLTKVTESTKAIVEKPMEPNSTDAEATQQKSQETEAKEAPTGGYKVELENPNQVSILSKEASIRVFPDSLEYDPWTNAIYRDGTVRSLNMTKPLDALSINDVASTRKNVPGPITPHIKIPHPVYFIAETGLGFVLASKPFYDGGIKFNVGGGLGMKLKPRIHLQLTGGYMMQDGGFDFERTSTVHSLSFGVRSQFNSLQPDRLHFIYGKLGAAYRFQRSTVDAHVGIQWLYGAQGNITVQQLSQVPPGNETISRYAWLSTDGLRKTQWWSDVSYGYMLLPKLYLHGGVTFYYSSLTEDAVPDDGYDWDGKTATVQPFFTLNYLLHANF